MKQRFLFLLCTLLIAANLNAEDGKLLSFMVHGEDHIVSVALPESWRVDMDAAHQMGVNGFFYLKRYTIDDTPAGIVLKLATKPQADSKLQEWINYDTAAFKSMYKGYRTTKLSWKIKNRKGYRVVVYKFENPKTDIVQYSAYIDGGLDYFANLYIQLFSKSKENEAFIRDFKNCLINSEMLGIGIKMKK